jgi:hypothetical protein
MVTDKPKTHSKRLLDCETAIIKMNAKMNAILWMFGILIAVEIGSYFFGG